MLFAAREGRDERLDAPGFAELRLGGLDAESAHAIVERASGGALAPEVAEWLVERRRATRSPCSSSRPP